jgi:hypothetical protein
MTPPDELLQSRSRAGLRKLAGEAAVVCALLAVCYVRVAGFWGRHPIPFVICLIAAAVFAFIGYALPDRRPPE